MLPCGFAMRRTFLLFALSLVATLLFAVPASANLQAILDDLRADGAIDPCAHTGDDLRAALEDIGPDVDQYAPEFPALIEDALAARAGGACSQGGGDSGGGGGGGSGGGGSIGGGASGGGGSSAAGGDGGGSASASGSVEGQGATPTPDIPLTASPAVLQETVPGAAPAATTTQASDAPAAPAPVLLLALLGSLVALGVAAWALARWWAFEPRWLVGTRHACTEAGYRASATWAEFSDWLRLGR